MRKLRESVLGEKRALGRAWRAPAFKEGTKRIRKE